MRSRMRRGSPEWLQRQELLERHFQEFKPRAHVHRDPIQFPHRYQDRQDIEVAAFVAASLAFGRVAAFGPVIDQILTALGPHPAHAILERVSTASGRKLLQAAVPGGYRWLQADELRALLLALGETLAEYGSLEHAFQQEHKADATDTWHALGALLATLRERAVAHHPRATERARALAFLFPSVAGNAACKRQHMFLRWMVRPPDDGVDFGLWPSVHPRNLVVPCDVHVARIGHALGMASRKEPSRRVADEITSALREVAPNDPVRFDFALAHLGISGGCRGKAIESICCNCHLRPACRWWHPSLPPRST